MTRLGLRAEGDVLVELEVIEEHLSKLLQHDPGTAYGSQMNDLTICLQAFVAASVLFVWVVRYGNIVAEFKQYGLPDWLRDLVGILKITFAMMLLIGIERGRFAIIGGMGIALLMGAAVLTHWRVKNPVVKMLPAFTLLLASAVIVWINFLFLTRR